MVACVYHVYRKEPARDGLSFKNLEIESQNNKQILPISKHIQNKNKPVRKQKKANKIRSKKSKSSNNVKSKQITMSSDDLDVDSDEMDVDDDQSNENIEQVVKKKQVNKKFKRRKDVSKSSDNSNCNRKRNDSESDEDFTDDESTRAEISEELRESLLPGIVKKKDRPKKIQTKHSCALTLEKGTGGVTCNDCDTKLRKGQYLYACYYEPHDFDLCYRCGIETMSQILD